MKICMKLHTVQFIKANCGWNFRFVRQPVRSNSQTRNTWALSSEFSAHVMSDGRLNTPPQKALCFTLQKSQIHITRRLFYHPEWTAACCWHLYSKNSGF